MQSQSPHRIPSLSAHRESSVFQQEQSPSGQQPVSVNVSVQDADARDRSKDDRINQRRIQHIEDTYAFLVAHPCHRRGIAPIATSDEKYLVYVDQENSKILIVSTITERIDELSLHTNLMRDDVKEAAIIETQKNNILLIKCGRKHFVIIKDIHGRWEFPFEYPSTRPDALFTESVRKRLETLSLQLLHTFKTSELEKVFPAALLLTAENGDHHITQALMKKGANPNSDYFANSREKLPLMKAIELKHYMVVKQILKHNVVGDKPESRDRWKKQIVGAFEKCILDKDIHTTRELLSCDTGVALFEHLDSIDLIKVVRSGDPRLIEIFIQYCRKRDFVIEEQLNHHFIFPLETQHECLIKYQLMVTGIQKSEKEEYLKAPYSSRNMPENLKRELSSALIDLYETPEYQKCFLRQRRRSVERDEYGHVALHHAVLQGDPKKAVKCIEEDSMKYSINIQRFDGCTPLHLAALTGSHGNIALLLKTDANTNIVNADNQKPRILASNVLAEMMFEAHEKYWDRHKRNKKGDIVLKTNPAISIREFARDAFWRYIGDRFIQGETEERITDYISSQYPSMVRFLQFNDTINRA